MADDTKEVEFRLRCTKAFKARLKRVAESENRSMSNLAVTVLQRYCDAAGPTSKRKPSPKKPGKGVKILEVPAQNKAGN